METSSVTKVDVWRPVDDFRWMMHDWLELAENQWLKIEVCYLHDNLKCHEMDDTMFNCVLVTEEVDIDVFCHQSCKSLDKAQKECNLRAMIYKLIWLIVCKLHHIHSFCYFRIETEMKSNCTWELDVKHNEWICKLLLIKFVKLLQHAKEHR